jgi:hypothetical protein
MLPKNVVLLSASFSQSIKSFDISVALLNSNFDLPFVSTSGVYVLQLCNRVTNIPIPIILFIILFSFLVYDIIFTSSNFKAWTFFFSSSSFSLSLVLLI